MTASQERPASAERSLFRSPRSFSASGNSSGFVSPRLKSVTSCPRPTAASTAARPRNCVPPRTSSFMASTVSSAAVPSDDRPLAVLGATGFTGGLVCDAARELGLPLRLLGRNRKALEERARSGDEVVEADATDHESLVAAIDGAFAVVTTAGPFLKKGFTT